MRQSVHQSYVEANDAYNALLAAVREERETAKKASIEASIAEEESSKQAERDDMQRVMEEQSVTPGKASDHETAVDIISDPVTGEDVTVPEGAAAVLPTEVGFEVFFDHMVNEKMNDYMYYDYFLLHGYNNAGNEVKVHCWPYSLLNMHWYVYTPKENYNYKNR